MFTFDDAKETDIEKEIKLIKKYRKTRDPRALEEICQLNYKFINYVLEKNFNFLSHVKEDLFQEGILGLYKAIESFNEDKAYGYIRFKGLHIFGAMKRFAKRDHKYVCFTHLGAQSDQGEESKGEDYNWLDGMVADENQERSADAKKIWGLLGQIPETERNVIKAKFKGLSHKEISIQENFTSRTLVDYYYKRAELKEHT